MVPGGQIRNEKKEAQEWYEGKGGAGIVWRVKEAQEWYESKGGAGMV